MNTKEYIKLSLVELGFTEGESRVYLIILNGFEVDVNFLKLKTRYSNAGIYKIINSLTDKGFIYSEGYPAKYFAVSVDKIAGKIFTKGRRLARLAQRLKNLDRINNMPDSSEVYEDNGFIDYYLNIPYKVDDFIWCVGSFGSVSSFLGMEVEKDFIKTRVKRGINCDALIFDDNSYSRKFGSSSRSEKRETRFISTSDYPLEFTYLFGDTTVTFYKDYDDKVKILKTTSKELARAKLFQYQLLWKSTAE